MNTLTLRISAACLMMLYLGGCVERALTITSDPPGALVYVSSEEKGRTPVTIPFTWYGDYEVTLRLTGYEALHTHCRVIPPVYEIPPFDLLSDMAPWTYHVDRSAHYQLAKLQLPTDAELVGRAEELRQRNLQNGR
jgi:hypothetical protein